MRERRKADIDRNVKKKDEVRVQESERKNKEQF